MPKVFSLLKMERAAEQICLSVFKQSLFFVLAPRKSSFLPNFHKFGWALDGPNFMGLPKISVVVAECTDSISTY